MLKSATPLISIVAASTVAFSTSAMAGENLDGFWIDSDGEVILEIGPCGEARCGKVAWLRQPLGPDGRALTDYRNPDPTLRHRPVCGLEVVSGFKKKADESWGGGTVYVSDQGASFSGYAQVLGPTQIKVTGYIGLPIFGASEVWTRVLDPVKVCWVSATQPTPPTWTGKVTVTPPEGLKTKSRSGDGAPTR